MNDNPGQRPQDWTRLASVTLVALIALCVLWEGWLAPLRPGGSWLILKGAPLLLAVRGVLRGRRYTSQWLSMLVLLYFAEGVMRAFDPGLIAWLARLEVVLSFILFVAVIGHARSSAPSRQRAANE
ncbi:membrane protein [Betaproteobacteria bacterium]|nr:membrane protein [Betaproteobacteria bacterium]GHU05721.1 membrane protein [Betaproteobacteria bacterium]GHU23607.1 membrane protein [Betaproteobacteria bacterium]